MNRTVLCLCIIASLSVATPASEAPGDGAALFPVAVDGKYGYIDTAGQMVIDPRFDEAREFRDSRAFVRVNNLWGVVNVRGGWVLRPQFLDGFYYSSGMAAVNTGPRAWLIDRTGKQVSRQFRRILSLFDEGLALVEDATGLWGYIDTAGNVAVEPQYEDALGFGNNRGPVMTGGKWGYIDRTGRMAIEPRFPLAGVFRSGLARVRLGDKTGYIDTTGQMVIEPQFDQTTNFIGSFARVKAGGEWGVINRQGRYVIPPVYDSIPVLNEGIATVNIGASRDPVTDFRKEGLSGYVDSTGRVISEPQFEEAKEFHQGRAVVKMNGTYGYIDLGGHTAIPLQYDAASDFYCGRAAVHIPGKGWGFIDTTGRYIVEPQYFGCHDHYADNRVMVMIKKGESYLAGYLDLEGTLVIPPKYRNTDWFENGFATVEMPDSGFGVIDTTGRAVVPCRYREVMDPGEGLVAVKQGSRWGYVDTLGRMVIEPQFRDAWRFSHGRAEVGTEHRWGFVDTAGNWAIAPQFDLADPSSGAFVVVGAGVWNGGAGFSGGKFGLVDRQGRFVVPPMYKGLKAMSEGLCAATEDEDHYGYIDSTGRWVVDPQFASADGFSEGLAAAAKAESIEDRTGAISFETKFGYIDPRGNWVVRPQYDIALPFSESLAAVNKGGEWFRDHAFGGTWRFIGRDGRRVFGRDFEGAGLFRDGLAPVAVKGKWGFIDHRGKLAIPPRFKYAETFDRGLAKVRTATGWGYINRSGRLVWQASPDKPGGGQPEEP